jgi:hypothetical protein
MPTTNDREIAKSRRAGLLAFLQSRRHWVTTEAIRSWYSTNRLEQHRNSTLGPDHNALVKSGEIERGEVEGMRYAWGNARVSYRATALPTSP